MKNYFKILVLGLILALGNTNGIQARIHDYASADYHQSAYSAYQLSALAPGDIDTIESVCYTGDYMPSYVGYGADPTNVTANWTLIGNVCHVEYMATAGTSNSSLYRMTLPFTPKFTLTVTPSLNYSSVSTTAVNDLPGRIDMTAGNNLCSVYHSQSAATWPTTGSKIVKFSIDYIINWTITAEFFLQRQIFFIGNSLSDLSAGNLIGGRRFPQTCYSSLRTSGMSVVPYQCYAVNGYSTTDMLADFPTFLRPYLREGDMVVLWELTVDISAEGKNAQQAYNDYVSLSDSIHAYDAYVIVLDMIARDNSGDPAWMEARRDSVNDLVWNDNTHFDKKIPIGQTPKFNEESDCTNTTYYNADKLHLTDVGYDSVAAYSAPLIWNFYSNL